jgi:putative endonuclease
MKRLVYAEEAGNAPDAIRREKQIKSWVRKKKIALIEALNPEWRDLGDFLFGE